MKRRHRKLPRCSSGKTPHPNARRARSVLLQVRATEVQAATPAESRPTNIYRCRECGYWHLTHKGGVL